MNRTLMFEQHFTGPSQNCCRAVKKVQRRFISQYVFKHRAVCERGMRAGLSRPSSALSTLTLVYTHKASVLFLCVLKCATSALITGTVESYLFVILKGFSNCRLGRYLHLLFGSRLSSASSSSSGSGRVSGQDIGKPSIRPAASSASGYIIAF